MKKNKMKKSKSIVVILVLLSLNTDIAFAQTTPSPEEIHNTVTNFWYGDNLQGFTSYTTNLYAGASTNYVAPTLLSAFHDYVFLGELVSASNKYARVHAKTLTSPDSFSNLFKGMLLMALESVGGDIKRYNDVNKPLNDAKTLAAPQEIRDGTSNPPLAFPHLTIINHSPEIQLD